MVQSADLRLPHSWYPLARSMKRRMIYHAGPTNSGKTHNAILALQKARQGVYCGPLRLLAMEIYERCNADGVFCSLLTGACPLSLQKTLAPLVAAVAITFCVASASTPTAYGRVGCG